MKSPHTRLDSAKRAGEAGAFGGRRQISTTWGLIAIFGAAVLLFGGALTYYYQMSPTTYDYETFNYSAPAKTASTADWKTYTNNTYGYSIKYPVTLDRSETIISNASDDSSFTIRPKAWNDRYFNIEVSKDTIENLLNKKKQSSGLTNFRKSDIKIGSTGAIQLLYDIIGSNGSSGTKDEKIVFLKDGNATLVFTGGPVKGNIANNLDANPSQAIWDQILLTFKFTSTVASSANTNANTNAQSNTDAWKTYTNSSYGFTLTFTDSWKGYKVKERDVEGAVATYYFELPTTDPSYQSTSNSSDAGYASPFAIGVMNKVDWTGSDDQLRDFGSKIAENANYVFTSSSWQAKPSEAIFDTISTQIKDIVASFKLN